MHVVDILIPVIWVIFWLGWLTAALAAKQTSRRGSSSLPIRVVILLLFIGLIRTGVLRGHSLAVHSPWLEGVGFVLFLSGIGLAVWARFFLGRNWGTPMSERVEPELVTSGPYRYVRHPIYSGLILALIGTAVALTPYLLVGVVLIGGFFVYSATVEERNMERLFPESYPAYKGSTKMLVPFLF
jgi:protein-S-isoprenylcysteine O-methyltransferase Ste14